MPNPQNTADQFADPNKQDDLSDEDILNWAGTHAVKSSAQELTPQPPPGKVEQPVAAAPAATQPPPAPPPPRPGEEVIPPQVPTVEPSIEAEIDQLIQTLPPVEVEDLTDDQIEALPPEAQGIVKRQKQALQQVRAEAAQLAERTKGLESTVGRQGRELGETKKFIEERDLAYQAGARQMDDQFRQRYTFAIASANRADLEAQDLERQGEMQAAQAKMAEAADIRLQATQAQIRYETRRTKDDSAQAIMNERALFEAKPEFRAVRNNFDDFLRDLGMNEEQVMGIRMNFDTMHRYYSIHLDRERGRPENFKRIAHRINEARIKQSARIATVTVPAAGTGSPRAVTSFQKDDEEEFPGMADLLPATGQGLVARK